MRLANDTEYGLSGSCRPTSGARCASRAGSRPVMLSVNSHSSVRYWTPFGGMKQSVWPRTRSGRAPGVHRCAENDSRSVTELSSDWSWPPIDHRDETRVWRQRDEASARSCRGDHRRCERYRPGHRTAVPGRGCVTVVVVDVSAETACCGSRRGRRRVPRGRRHRRSGGTGSLRACGRHARRLDIAFNNAGERNLPAGRRLDPRHRSRRVGARAAGRSDQRLLVLQIRDSAYAGVG